MYLCAEQVVELNCQSANHSGLEKEFWGHLGLRSDLVLLKVIVGKFRIAMNLPNILSQKFDGISTWS